MSDGRSIVVLIGLISHLFLSIDGTFIIWKSLRFTSKQKKTNTLILWLFPFVWYLLIKAMVKRTPGSHEVKKKDDVTNNSFHESGKGSPWLNKY